MLVLDPATNRVLANIITGPGSDAIAFAQERGLIFVANGGGYRSVTIVRQDFNDDYTVVQTLPTMERARTLAVDLPSGNLYVVTDLYGARLDHPPAKGIDTLKLKAIENTFQVLVIGN